MGEFSNLPESILCQIEQHLELMDKIRIHAVCSSWNSLLPTVPKLRSGNLPWMLKQDNTKGASIYSVHESATYPLDLPEIKNKIFKGSSYGWIVTLDDADGGIDDIGLFNPLTRAQIQLPPRSTFPDIEEYRPDRVGEEYVLKDKSLPEDFEDEEDDGIDEDDETDSEDEEDNGIDENDETDDEDDGIDSNDETDDEDDELDFYCVASKLRVNQTHIEKIVLSSPPSSKGCMAVAIFGEFNQLAWCRLGDKKWTPFKEYSGKPGQRGFTDVIFHNGKLHAVHFNGKLVVYDTIDPEVNFTEVVSEVQESVKLSTPMYLVQCSDLGLLLVPRWINYEYDKEKNESSVFTDCFFLYKLVDLSTNNGSKEWVEIEKIGDNMLFVGLSLSLSVPVSDELKRLGYKGNCIYFMDDSNIFMGKSQGHKQEESDIGVLDLDDDEFNDLPGFSSDAELLWPPPIWVTHQVLIYQLNLL